MPHTRCHLCQVPVDWDTKRKRLLEIHTAAWTVHRCDMPMILDRLAECVCGLIVWVTPKDERLLWPSRAEHRPHPPFNAFKADIEKQIEGWDRYLTLEQERAQMPLVAHPGARVQPIRNPAAYTAPRPRRKGIQPL